jgi:DNA-binding MarR family transcriptional regulator
MQDCGCNIRPGMMKSFVDKRMKKKCEPLGITASQGPFIHEIGLNDGISLKALTAIVMVDKALTTRSVKSLIDNGFVSNSGQGRMYSLHLTEKGKATDRKIAQAMKEVMNELLSNLNEDERRVFDTLAEKIYKKLQEDLK